MVGDPTLNTDFSIDLFPSFDTPNPGSQIASSGGFLEQSINPNDDSVSGAMPAFDPLALATNALAQAKTIAAPLNFGTGQPDTALAKRAVVNPISPAQRTILPAGLGQYAPALLAVGALLLIWAIADL